MPGVSVSGGGLRKHLEPAAAHSRLLNKGTKNMLEHLPAHVRDALFAYRTCEFATLAKDGTPIAVPVSPVILPEQERIVITTSIGLPNKAFNVRRDGRVSLLFSDPTASGLEHPPAVLIQGDAVCPDRIETWTPELEQLWRMLDERQPASRIYVRFAFMRWLMDWYYMRLLIWVTPRHVRWWEHGDFATLPHEFEKEMSYVG
jgi:predicted pyridoxine 5'-phosphate oxidase superfamily flavin-nucleotide-binding protein